MTGAASAAWRNIAHIAQKAGRSLARGREETFDALSGILGRKGALALGEVHGDYAFADFVTDFIPHAAKAGATRLYVEMFRREHQPLIDAWQDGGREDAIVGHIDSRTMAYSQNMWVHYWQVLQAASKNGIRVVAIEPDEVYSPYPGMEMLARNIEWQKNIDADQKSDGAGAPYLLYCGLGHLSRRICKGSSPIDEMMDIPGVTMKHGRVGACSLAHGFVKAARSFNLFVPRAANQTPIFPLKMAPSMKIRHIPNAG